MRRLGGEDLEQPLASAGAIGCVTANRRAIDHYRSVPLASSGPVANVVDLVVARRFKARGLSCFRRGAGPLLRLPLLCLNGTCARYRISSAFG